MVDPGAVERVVGNNALIRSNSLGNRSLMYALRSHFVQQRHLGHLSGHLRNTAGQFGIHGQRCADSRLICLSAEGGVRAAGVELADFDAGVLLIFQQAFPGSGIIADAADRTDKQNVMLGADFQDLRQLFVEPLVIVFLQELLGADPAILHLGAEFLQAVEEGAGPMMGTIDVMGGLGRNPADALLTRAFRMRRSGTEVTGRHADRVFDFDAAIGCSQVCHCHFLLD